MSTIELMPTLDVRDEDVYFGEEIIFRAGLRCAVRVDAGELTGRACQLVITAPNGRVTELSREATTYDGPPQIAAFEHREHLPDLVEPLLPGVYELRYACEGREARRRIRVHKYVGRRPRVDVAFPERADTGRGAPFAVRLEVANVSGAQLSVVEPDSCYAASVVGLTAADDPPWGSRLRRSAEPAPSRVATYRTPIEVERRSALTVVDLAPGERRTYEVRFDEVLPMPEDAERRPRERFGVTVAFVVHAFEPGIPRPIRWLRRARAEYLVTGVLQSVGEALCREWEWAHVSPSGW